MGFFVVVFKSFRPSTDGSHVSDCGWLEADSDVPLFVPPGHWLTARVQRGTVQPPSVKTQQLKLLAKDSPGDR